jgi:signal transduction histidine kinase
MSVLKRAAGAARQRLDLVLTIAVPIEGAIELATTDVLHPKRAWIGELVVFSIAFALRRRWPLEVLIVLLVTQAVVSLTPGTSDPAYAFFAVVITTATIGFREEGRRANAGLAIVIVVYLIGGTVDGNIAPGDIIFGSIVFGGAWGLGRAVRERQHMVSVLQRETDLRAREAVADERARIARELHDVIAHNVSVMTMQAGGVRRLLRPDQTRERDVLVGVEETGREAIAELRRLLGIMRRSDDGTALRPQPSIARLDELVDSVREVGLPVRLTVDGEPHDLSPGLDLSAYRIVQEALTNTLKHGGRAHADVTVRWLPRALELDISDDGRGGPIRANGSGGQGLVGMRERVTLFGGDLDVGPRESGGFRVRARLPLEVAPK